MKLTSVLVGDSDGGVIDLPEWTALGQNGVSVREPAPEESIPLPDGAHLYFLPDRTPLGRKSDKIASVKGFAVAAILPQGYTRTLLPAYQHPNGAEWLPYFGYAACFLKDGKLHAAANATHPDSKWDPKNFNPKTLAKKIQAKLQSHPDNRMLSQLSICAAESRCYTAANVFFERWEGALPVSPSCNSACRGCISKAEDPGPPSPQERFGFVPTVEECVEIVKHHFEKAEDPIISFGQGCEGEPSLQSELIEKIIKTIRPEFPRGQFHMNTNGSRPKDMKQLFKAGLDSIRVSLNSAQENWYNAYYRPKNYRFHDLDETIRIAKNHGVHVSLNLLCFPGVTDHPREMEAFFKFLGNCKPDLIQLRNLNIDPWRYLKESIREEVSGIGMIPWMKTVRTEFPSIHLGSFTPYIKQPTALIDALKRS